MMPTNQRLAPLLFLTVAFAVTSQAQAADCESESDCMSYETCFASVVWDCPDDLDTSCIEGESDPECTERVEALMEEKCTRGEDKNCIRKWLFPCSTTDDCGVEGVVCENTTCTPVNPTCTTADDCPDHWLCLSDGGEGLCIGAMPEEPGTVVVPDSGEPVHSGEGGEAATPDKPNDDDAPSGEGEENEDESANDNSSGCSIARTNPLTNAPSAFLLGILGAGLTLARRRRRAC